MLTCFDHNRSIDCDVSLFAIQCDLHEWYSMSLMHAKLGVSQSFKVISVSSIHGE